MFILTADLRFIGQDLNSEILQEKKYTISIWTSFEQLALEVQTENKTCFILQENMIPFHFDICDKTKVPFDSWL